MGPRAVMRTAGVVMALVISVSRAALGELEEAGPSGLPRVEAAGSPADGALSSARTGVGGVALDPKIAQEIARYRALAPQLESSAVGLPILVKSQKESWSFRGDVYTIVHQPFEVVRDELGNPGGWCEVLPLHFNVKACTYAISGDLDSLTLYLGRKFYQPIERTRVLELEFSAAPVMHEFLDVRLRAETGPIGTKDHALSLFAIPLDADRSLIHFRLSHGYGLVARMAMYSYLLTLGRTKLGFSVVGEDGDGMPLRVRGEQGVIERNAVRYHLAIQAYLETLELPASLRFESRLSRWYDLTDAHPEQLHEMEKREYLGYKRRERAEQARLQSELLIAVGH